MRTLKFLCAMFFFAFILTACQKDDISLTTPDAIELRNGEDRKMVPFKGNFQVLPFGTDSIPCFDNELGITLMAVVNNEVVGNATHLGKIDQAESRFVSLDCELNYIGGYVFMHHDIILMNGNGDGLFFHGSSTSYLSGPGSGYFEVVEGYGKFVNATGWIETTGDISAPGGPVFRADGEVTQPNH